MEKMHFAWDKNNVLYMSTPGALHARSIADLQSFSDDMTSLNADNGNQRSSDVMHFGPLSRSGVLEFERDFNLIFLYDNEKSWNNKDDKNSVIGVFSRKLILDFNQIVSEENEEDSKKLDIRIIQLEE